MNVLMIALHRCMSAGITWLCGFVMAAVCWSGIIHKATATAQETVVILDGAAPGRVFEGVGELSAGASSRLLFDYPEPQRSEILDLLFKPKFGAGLHHLKVEIGGDVNSTDGSEPSHAVSREEFEHPKPEYFQRGYEWWLMREAKKRNPAIMLETLQWGAPGWIGDGKFYSQDNADFVVSFIKGARQYHGLTIDYTGIRNEVTYDIEYIKLLRKTLDDNQLHNVKIDAGDLYRDGQMWAIADDMLKDPSLNECIAVINAHTNGTTSSPSALRLNKPIWNGEAHPHGGDWNAAAKHARYYRSYVEGGITKIISWSLITSYHDFLLAPNSGPMEANTPWSGYYEIQPLLWVVAHMNQFAEPGWKYLDNSCRVVHAGGREVWSLSALKSPAGGDYSLVIETTDAKQPQTVHFKLAGGLSTKDLAVYRTVFKQDAFQRLEDIPVRDGQFTITVLPNAIYSLTTTRGQQKGQPAHPIPVDRPFPFPFKTDFEDREFQQPATFFSDQHGTFVIAPRPDGRGKCLKQLMTRQGIQWLEYRDAQTIAGDIQWKDYRVSVDLMLPGAGVAKVWGRVHPPDKEDWARPIIGYEFAISRDGAWIFKTEKDTLATGKSEPLGGTWHTAALVFAGPRMTVEFDRQPLTTVSDTSYQAGVVGLGTGFNEAYFDNLQVSAR